jgi:hypothetical protein
METGLVGGLETVTSGPDRCDIAEPAEQRRPGRVVEALAPAQLGVPLDAEDRPTAAGVLDCFDDVVVGPGCGPPPGAWVSDRLPAQGGCAHPWTDQVVQDGTVDELAKE